MTDRDTIIVVPCYNEARRLDAERMLEFVGEHPDCGLLFVDDGSTDRTPEILRRHASESSGIALMCLETNGGKGEAVRTGILRAFEYGPSFVGYWDADHATPLTDALRFREHLLTHPELLAVFGSRVLLLGRRISRNPLRHYIGRVFATGASLALGMPVYDTQCGAKLFRVTDEVRAVFEDPFMDRWIFDVELLSRLAGGRGRDAARLVHEWPLDSWEDVQGSKVRLVDGLRAWWTLARIWASRGGR